MNFWIFLSAGQALRQQKDTEDLNAEPDWELNFVASSLSENSIKPGFMAAIPESSDDSKGGWITNFYYCEHEGSDKNTIEVVATDGDRFRFRLYGKPDNVNYYDGSKPAMKLLTDLWFESNKDGGRAMS